ncbi:MAG: RIP metalloprotease RseP [Deltaproteobacteria bacterium]|nr:RIP metalloprotease RseP [Deltaproteobacteria bacterium]
MSIIYFLVLVGVLVVIHELGHFAAAKLLDVKVLRFSLGYGRPLVRVKGRETEYQIAVFPIGGYVRLLGIEGETPNKADAGRSFASRPLWQRLVIVFAGPAANLILPIAIYFVFFAGHTMVPAAQIGDVFDGSVAQRAGLEPGDRVLEIDGQAVRYWEDIEQIVQHSTGKELHLRISRNGKTFERYLTPIEESVWSKERDGKVSRQGRVGIKYAPYIPLVGVIDAQSPAGRAGLRTQDLLISIDGQPVRNWSDVVARLGKVARRSSIVYFRGTEMPGVPQVQLLAAGFADLVPDTQLAPTGERQTYTGLEHAEMFVARVDPGSPADAAGLKPGDLITALDDKPVTHWVDLDQRLQAEPTRAFKVTWKRAAQGGKTETLSADVTQVWRKQHDEYEHTVTRLVFGAYDDIDRGTGAMVPIEGRVSFAMTRAVDRTRDTVRTVVVGFFHMLGGDSPSDALGGPLTVYQAASVSGSQGWDSFLRMLALISVNLGLINLLPIPMLDGGHLLIFAIEALRRRRLTPQARERIQQVGLAVILLVLLLALRNDVMRFVSR